MLLVQLQFRKGSSITANMTETMQVTCLKGKHRLIYVKRYMFFQRGEEGEDPGQQEQGAEGAGEAGRHVGEGDLDDGFQKLIKFAK